MDYKISFNVKFVMNVIHLEMYSDFHNHCLNVLCDK